jgi:hypothetical protein
MYEEIKLLIYEKFANKVVFSLMKQHVAAFMHEIVADGR